MNKLILSCNLTDLFWFFGMKPDLALSQHFHFNFGLFHPSQTKVVKIITEGTLLWVCWGRSGERKYIPTHSWLVWAHGNEKYIHLPRAGLLFVSGLEQIPARDIKIQEERRCSSRKTTQGGGHWSTEEMKGSRKPGWGTP